MRLPAKPFLLAFQGSPRRQGSTTRLLTSFLKGCGHVRTLFRNLPSLRILPCRGCGRCEQGLTCAQKDGMPALLELMEAADALVLAAPVYFYGFPSQVKAVIDRCQPVWQRPPVRKQRPAFFISSCAAENPKEFQVIVREAKAFFNTVGFHYQDDLLVPGMDQPSASQQLIQACRLAQQKGSHFVSRNFHE